MEERNTDTEDDRFETDSDSDNDACYNDEYLRMIEKQRSENTLTRKVVLGNAGEELSESLRDYKNRTSSPKPHTSKNKIVVKFNFSRRSIRLAGLSPFEYSCDDYLSDVDEDRRGQKRRRYFSEDSDEERPRRRMCVRMSHVERFFVEPNNVTPEVKRNIARRVSDKVYDQNNGFTCHQCRQKTRDTKSVCRSKNCRGVRGQFCGICLKNHYGEDLAEILEKDDWLCPYCRGVCHCSFCRKSKGLPPLGIIINQVRKFGYQSVLDYLVNGQRELEEGDSISENNTDLASAENIRSRKEDVTAFKSQNHEKLDKNVNSPNNDRAKDNLKQTDIVSSCDPIAYFDMETDVKEFNSDDDFANKLLLGWSVGPPPQDFPVSALRSTIECLDQSLWGSFLMENISQSQRLELIKESSHDLRNKIIKVVPEHLCEKLIQDLPESLCNNIVKNLPEDLCIKVIKCLPKTLCIKAMLCLPSVLCIEVIRHLPDVFHIDKFDFPAAVESSHTSINSKRSNLQLEEKFDHVEAISTKVTNNFELVIQVSKCADDLIPYFDDDDTPDRPFLGYHIGSPPEYISVTVLRSTLESLDSSLRKKFLMRNISGARRTELMRYLPDDLCDEVIQDLPENAPYQLQGDNDSNFSAC